MTTYRPKIPQKPLVVCVGFLGSKPRHVQKYADLMGSLDVNVAPLSSNTPIITKPEVVQYIPPLSTFTSFSKIRQSAVGLADVIENKLQTPAPLESTTKGRILFPYQTEPLKTPDYILNDIDNYQPRKVIFLCLSNNGAFGYANLLNLLKKERPQLLQKVNSQTAGVIWDSSPSHPTPDVFERGFVSALGTLMGRAPQAKDPILSPIVSSLVSYLLTSDLYKKAAAEVTDILEHNVPYHAPQLYLITEQDDLVLPDATREYVKNRSKRVRDFFSRFSSHRHFQDIAASSIGGSIGTKNPNQGQGRDSWSDNDQVVDSGDYKLNFQYQGHNLDGKTTQFSPEYEGINDKIKSNAATGVDWDLIDKHQAGFALHYNYNQHIYPHFPSHQLPTDPQTAKAHPNINYIKSFDDESIKSTVITSPQNDQSVFSDRGEGSRGEDQNNKNNKYDDFHHYHHHTTKHLQSHFSSLDLSKLPPLVDYQSLGHLSMHKSAFQHGHEHEGSTALQNSSNSEQFEPTFLDHIQYCPHNHHLDVIFDPKKKIQLDSLKSDPKIKPLFTKTERQPDCDHHFLYDFKDSAHVQHIRRHPEQYKELVEAFCNYAFRG